MVFFNYATMQMAAKIVYYGPGLCGKTTNLHHIYTKTSPQSRGEMVSLETETDRTLFFDLLPIDVGVIGGFKTRLQLYTIPGQVFYNTTRKLVLKGVDGLVFVADSQMAMVEANLDSFKNLRENLAEIGLHIDEIPLVLQLNKRDLPNITSVDTLLNALDPERKYEYVEAVAATGTGVFETLKLISKLTLRTLRRRMTGDDQVKTAPRPALRDIAQFRVKDEAHPTSPPQSTTAAIGTTPGVTSGAFAAPPAAAASAATAPSAPQTRIAVEEEIEQVPASDEVFPERASAPPPPAARHAAPNPPPAPVAEPEVEMPQDDKPLSPPVKTVKVRSTIDVMAELEALRKRATQTAPKASRKEPATGKELKKAVNLSIAADVLARSRAMRVTVSFEDAQGEVVQESSESVELDGPGAQSVSLNVRIDKE